MFDIFAMYDDFWFVVYTYFMNHFWGAGYVITVS